MENSSKKNPQVVFSLEYGYLVTMLCSKVTRLVTVTPSCSYAIYSFVQFSSFVSDSTQI